MIELLVFVFVTAAFILVGLFLVAEKKPVDPPTTRLRRVADGPRRSRIARGRE